MKKYFKYLLIIVLIIIFQLPIFAESSLVMHNSYLNGFKDNSFRPNDKITREQAASILSKSLINGNIVRVKENKFSDLKETKWSYYHIAKLNNLDIINNLIEKDDQDKIYIYPEKELTRGEFIEILYNSYDKYHTLDIDLLLPMVKETDFTDIKNHKYEEAITHMASRDLIKGYPDKTFRPDQALTRAEFIKVYNAYLKRDFKLVEEKEINLFKDVKKTDWFYKDIIKASVNHYSKYKNGENYMILENK